MADKKYMEYAHELIDLVEGAIREKFYHIDVFADNYTVDDEQPHTLLYGETYYNLENIVIDKLREMRRRP